MTILSCRAGHFRESLAPRHLRLKPKQELSFMFRPRPSRRLFIFLSFALLLLSAPNALSQAETWVPDRTGIYVPEVKIWTSASTGSTFAKVRLTFINSGYRVSDWGQITRVGNEFIADAKIERWTGASAQALVIKENTYNLGVLSPGTYYTFTFKSYGMYILSQQFDPAAVIERWEPTTLPSGQVSFGVWTIPGGHTTAMLALYFPDTGYRVTDWGQISQGGNQFSVDVKVERWTGDSEGRTIIAFHDYDLGALAAGSYSITVKMHGTTIKTQPFTISALVAAPKILTEENSDRAIALDSVTWMRLFPIITQHNFSSDQRARIMLFATNIGSSDQNVAAVTAQAEDAAHNIYSLAVEYVGKVPGLDWLTQIIVRPPDTLKNGGDVWVQIRVRGVASNKALLNIKPADANQ